MGFGQAGLCQAVVRAVGGCWGSQKSSGCGFGAVLLSDSPVRPESPHKRLWLICCIIPPCSNVFYVSSDDVSDVEVAVVFSPFNSQGGTLFMATLLAKKMGEK